MKSLRDEIRLRREIRADLISSAKQISSELARISSRLRDFIEKYRKASIKYNHVINLETFLSEKK